MDTKLNQKNAPAKKTILVAEDEPTNYKLLETILRKEGFNILWAQDGNMAIEMALKHIPDLILMDIKMPETNGIAAMLKIKESYPAIPIIAQTAYALANEIIELESKGFDAYIAKPIIPAKFRDLIKTFLSK